MTRPARSTVVLLPPRAIENATKTICDWGHSLADAYVWVDARGRWHRRCRVCQCAANRACYRRRRQREAAA